MNIKLSFVCMCIILLLLVIPLQAMPSESSAHSHTNTVVSINNYLVYQLINSKDPLSEVNIKTVLEAILEKNGMDIDKVVTLSATLKSLSFKVKHMIHLVKKCKGGIQRAKLLTKWNGTNYGLKINYATSSPRKRKLENDLQTEIKKRKILQCDLDSSFEVIEELNATNEALCKEIEKAHPKHRGERGTTKCKENYSVSQKRRHVKKTLAEARNITTYLKPKGISPILLVCQNQQGEQFTVDFQDKLNTPDRCSVDQALYIKDRFNISHRAYHELAMQCDLPNQNKIANRMKELNNNINIFEVSANFMGVFQSIQERLIVTLTKCLLDPDMCHLLKDNVAKIKISGDGTRIGKRMHVLNFVYSLIGEDGCAGERGSYLIGIVKVPEKYECIKEGLKEIIQEVNGLKYIDVMGKNIRIELFLGGDLKFLNLVNGIDGFGSHYSCLWCKCPSKERHDTKKEWSMTNPELGARTVEEISQCSTIRIKAKKYNCSHKPIFLNIAIDHVVPDTLHLFLRIADQLVNHLIYELRKKDNVTANSTTYTPESCSNMSCFEKMVQGLGIEWQFCVNKDSRKITSRDFTGPEHWKIFTYIKLEEIIPWHVKLELIKILWASFISLMNMLKGPLSEHDIDLFHTNSVKWLDTFTLVYVTTDVTPYMHVLVHHIPEALRLHGNLAHFSQQGLEKLNDRVTGWYFRSSNHKGVEALRQIMLKQNRLESLHITCQRSLKFQITCSKCGNVGHNKRTCIQV